MTSTEEPNSGNGTSAAQDFAAALHPELYAALAALDGLDGRDPCALQAALSAVLTAAGDDARLRDFARIAAVERLQEHLGRRSAQQAVNLVFVEPAAPKANSASAVHAGVAIAYDDDEPAEQPQSLRALLVDINNFILHRVHLASEAAVALSLWVVLTYAADSFRRVPYLVINSPVKRCGKSTLLDVLARLVYRAQPAANATPAVLFRLLAQHHPTLLLDESDRWLAGKNANPDLIALVNAGNTRGTPALRTVGDDHQAAAFDVYGPKAIAGIGALPDTVTDRGIVIAMRRKPPGVKMQRITWADKTEATALRRRIVRWVQDSGDALAVVDLDTVQLPDELHDRARDCWEPLGAIASLAGDESIVGVVGEAAKRLAKAQVEPETVGIRLLCDLQRLFARANRDKLLSSELCEQLAALDDDAPWRAWHRHARETEQRRIQPTDLAHLLKPFGVRSRQIRTPHSTGKGYRLVDLTDAFERYLPPAAAVATNVADTCDALS